MPLGAPGEIVFSGVCVGRGYMNDPERTRSRSSRPATARANGCIAAGTSAAGGRTASWSSSAVATPGQGLAASGSRSTRSRTGCSRSGRPRRRGRRCRECDRAARLVAFYSADWRARCRRHPRSSLEQSLPAVHGPDDVPLAGGAAVDRQRQGRPQGACRHVAGELRVADSTSTYRPRRTSSGSPAPGRRSSESRRTDIGRHDHFFDRGGTSLSAVKLAIALDRAVSHNDVASIPSLLTKQRCWCPMIADRRRPR